MAIYLYISRDYGSFFSIVVYVQTNLEENNGTNIGRSFKINCQVLARNY